MRSPQSHLFVLAVSATLSSCVATPGAAPEDIDTAEQAATAAHKLGDTVQAEAYSSQKGTTLQNSNTTVGSFDSGDYLCYANIDMTSVNRLDVRLASSSSGGVFTVRLDSSTGTQLGSYTVQSTGGSSKWQTKSINLSIASGVHTLCLVGASKSGIANLDYFTLANGSTCPVACGLGFNCLNGQCTTSSSYYDVGAAYAPAPDLGPNVKVYTPSTPVATINADLSTAYANYTGKYDLSEFTTARYAFLFAPGAYGSTVDIPIGYYTQVAGLGDMPDAVDIAGAIHSDGDPSTTPPKGGLKNFWRSIENLKHSGTAKLQWVVSQATPFRRMHVKAGVSLFQSAGSAAGYVSGGFIADSWIEGTTSSGSQQQWFTRNSTVNWSGKMWNMVFEGVSFTNTSPPLDSSFPGSAYTVVATTNIVREKPFLYVDRSGGWNVFVPAIRTNTSSYSWTAAGTEAGTKIPLTSFYVAKPGDNAATMNAALSQGKHFLITPGIYTLNAPLHVTAANTVILGLGMATLAPQGGAAAISVDDVDGVNIAGLLFEAGATRSSVLLQVGPTGSSASHSGNPTSLHDLFFRVGGSQLGMVDTALQINSNDVIGDHFWAWRADHGTGVGWTTNTASSGVVVNGNNVTIHGLFVEHFQSYQTVWNGANGKAFFYQSELPYDAPTQADWQHGAVNGFASYKVNGAGHVAQGLGIYGMFKIDLVNSDNAIEAAAGSRFHHLVTLSIGKYGHVYNVINGTGGAANPGDYSTYPRVTDYAN